MAEAKREMVVRVGRESLDGRAYSEVGLWPIEQYQPRFVVDREKGRGMDERTIISRAKSLAVLLGFRYVEDLRWLCVADKLMPCRCPVCCGATNGMEPQPDPVPVTLDPRTRAVAPKPLST